MHVAALVDDFLSMTHFETGSFAICKEPCRTVRDIVDPAWRMMLTHFRLSDRLDGLSALTKEVAEDVPSAIVADATRVIQIVTNLLTNAIKFTPRASCFRCSRSTGC